MLPAEKMEAMEDIFDAMLWFGQVAKFRCRSNISAYDNFARLCLDGIAHIERMPIDIGHDEIEVLKVKR